MKGLNYTIGKHRKLPDGSIWVRTVRWDAFALFYVPVLMLGQYAGRFLPHALENQALFTALGLIAIAYWQRPGRVLLFDVPRRRVRVAYFGFLPPGPKIDMPFDDIEAIEMPLDKWGNRNLELARKDGTTVALGIVPRRWENRNILLDVRAIIGPA